MRIRVFAPALVILFASALPIRAQDAGPPSATMAETVQWIADQAFHLEATYPEVSQVLIDEFATSNPSFTCGTEGGLRDQHFRSGCSRATYQHDGVLQDDGCYINFARTPIRISAPTDCTGSLSLTAEADLQESVHLWDGPVYSGAEPYQGCMRDSWTTVTAHATTRISIPLADYAGASDRPTSGSPNQRFWLLARDSRDVFSMTTEVRSSRYHTGGQHALVHSLLFIANSREMSARLTRAFQHIADLCASARPAEPF
jgi:hypothetical protein